MAIQESKFWKKEALISTAYLGLSKIKDGTMDVNRTLALYCNKSESKQVEFLSCLGLELTIFARDTYEVGNDSLSNPKQLRCINEIMHRILGQQEKILLGDHGRYPDESFIKMIFQMAASCGFEKHLLSGIKESFGLHTNKVATGT